MLQCTQASRPELATVIRMVWDRVLVPVAELCSLPSDDVTHSLMVHPLQFNEQQVGIGAEVGAVLDRAIDCEIWRNNIQLKLSDPVDLPFQCARVCVYHGLGSDLQWLKPRTVLHTHHTPSGIGFIQRQQHQPLNYSSLALFVIVGFFFCFFHPRWTISMYAGFGGANSTACRGGW